MATDRLPRLSIWNPKSRFGVPSDDFGGRVMPRQLSPRSGSTFTTSAPKSASTAPALGAATKLVTSTTRTSDNGELIATPRGPHRTAPDRRRLPDECRSWRPPPDRSRDLRRITTSTEPTLPDPVHPTVLRLT